ncbi:hypothetical protein [Streptomyces sp. NPDC051677]|uniref:hypothetical protein n=1 Tax=Streptomyces sp. NPDC051677 TaxID=3365669 RepID=UPI0037D94F25
MVLLYILAFLLGIGEAAYDNAAQSLVLSIVADERLERADSTLITAVRPGQDLAGPAHGDVLFILFPVGGAISVCPTRRLLGTNGHGEAHMRPDQTLVARQREGTRITARTSGPFSQEAGAVQVLGRPGRRGDRTLAAAGLGALPGGSERVLVALLAGRPRRARGVPVLGELGLVGQPGEIARGAVLARQVVGGLRVLDVRGEFGALAASGVDQFRDAGRAVQRRRRTPTTLPRICTSSPGIG